MRFILTWLFFIFASSVSAHDYNVTNINNVPRETISGTALGIATAQHNFDMGTYQIQGSIGTGSYNGSEAVSFALAKRYKDILINGSYGLAEGKNGIGLGVTWRF